MKITFYNNNHRVIMQHESVKRIFVSPILKETHLYFNINLLEIPYVIPNSLYTYYIVDDEK